jgi:uncharacterized protein (TIGR03086 family)
MPLPLPEAHARALDATGLLVAGVSADQWHDPTPCDEWDVHQLVNHVVAGNWWVAPLVGGQSIADVGDRYDGDVLGDDPLDVYRESAASASAAFLAPGAMEAACAVSYGPVPGEIYAGHRLLDVLVHGWDLAEATGQDTRLDPDLIETLWAAIEPQLDGLAASGAFGHRIEPPAGADAETRLLAALGRTG